MTTSEILSLIISSISALATFAAFATCFITYKSTRPAIKIKINKKIAFQNVFYSSNNYAVTLCIISATNKSQVAGIIDEAYLKFKKKTYFAVNNFTNYDNLQPCVTIQDKDKNTINTDKFKLKLPIEIPAFKTVSGYLTFFNLPLNYTGNSFTARLVIRVAGFNRKRIFHITFRRTETANA